MLLVNNKEFAEVNIINYKASSNQQRKKQNKRINLLYQFND